MKLDLDSRSAYHLLEKLREEKPLVQCITNFVSMDIMANCLLAIGASPAMVHCAEEAADFQKIASALLINVGTLSTEWVAGMKMAAGAANILQKPWVLDPVAAGATPFRTETIVYLAKLRPWVIRGNASEIMALAGAAGATRGVDSTAESSEAVELGKQLALDLRTIVAISGKVDYVTDGTRVLEVHNGTPMLQKITATGCSLTALIAAFVSCAQDDPLVATAHAMSIFGLAGQIAEVVCEEAVVAANGPGALRVQLIDTLYTLGQSDLVRHVHIAEQAPGSASNIDVSDA